MACGWSPEGWKSLTTRNGLTARVGRARVGTAPRYVGGLTHPRTALLLVRFHLVDRPGGRAAGVDAELLARPALTQQVPDLVQPLRDGPQLRVPVLVGQAVGAVGAQPVLLLDQGRDLGGELAVALVVGHGLILAQPGPQRRHHLGEL